MITRHVIKQELDRSTPRAEQPPEAIKRVIDEISRVLPTITRFEDSWPVRLYVEMHLDDHQKRFPVARGRNGRRGSTPVRHA